MVSNTLQSQVVLPNPDDKDTLTRLCVESLHNNQDTHQHFDNLSKNVSTSLHDNLLFSLRSIPFNIGQSVLQLHITSKQHHTSIGHTKEMCLYGFKASATTCSESLEIPMLPFDT